MQYSQLSEPVITTIENFITSFWNWVTGTSNWTHEQAITLIREELDYNRSKSNSWFPFKDDLKYSQIRDIINAYDNLQIGYYLMGEAINPYNPKGNVFANEEIITRVSLASSQDKKLVKSTLKQLYYSTSDGRIPTTAFIDPVADMATSEYRITPNNFQRHDVTSWLFKKLGLADASQTPEEDGGIEKFLANTTEKLLLGALGVVAVGAILYYNLK